MQVTSEQRIFVIRKGLEALKKFSNAFGIEFRQLK